MLADVNNAFQGGLSTQNYLAIIEAAFATATRDLAGPVALGAFPRTEKNPLCPLLLEV